MSNNSSHNWFHLSDRKAKWRRFYFDLSLVGHREWRVSVLMTRSLMTSVVLRSVTPCPTTCWPTPTLTWRSLVWSRCCSISQCPWYTSSELYLASSYNLLIWRTFKSFAVLGSPEDSVSARDVSCVRCGLLPRSLHPPSLSDHLPRWWISSRTSFALDRACHVDNGNQSKRSEWFFNEFSLFCLSWECIVTLLQRKGNN